MAKLIQVSDDSGANWFTLPGAEGDYSEERGSTSDTVFEGGSFESSEVTLTTWGINAQAYYKGFAGYVADIKKQGTSTTLTDEPMSLESGKIYVVTDAAKRILNRAVTIVVDDDASDETDEVEWIDYLFGRIKFKDSYTVQGAVTISGAYFPTAVLGRGNSFTLGMTAEAIVTSYFATVQANGGFHTHDPGLRTVNMELNGIFDASTGLRAILEAGSELIVEVNPDGNAKSVARGFFRAQNFGQSGRVGALEEETVNFVLNVPDEPLMLIPFSWRHTNDTTLSPAVQKMLTAYLDETKLDVRYLYDGTNGYEGAGVLTNVTLTGGLESMNEFAAEFRGDGAPADVP